MSEELKTRAVCHACASHPRAWLCPVCDNELAALKAGHGEAWKCSGCGATSGASCNANGCFENERDAPPATGVIAPSWRCFHCDEHFADEESATLHFGDHEHKKPACLIDVAEYRAMEARMHSYNEEDAEIHRAMARMHGQHRTALQREEEKGYARALKDTGYDASVDAVSVPRELLEIEWLEHWLLFAAEPIGQECCNRPGLECCGCPDTCYRTADDIAAAMNARHEELRALLARQEVK